MNWKKSGKGLMTDDYKYRVDPLDEGGKRIFLLSHPKGKKRFTTRREAMEFAKLYDNRGEREK